MTELRDMLASQRMLNAIALASRAAVLERYRPDSCIATTRVVTEVARYWGVTVRPWAVNVRLFTEGAWELAEAGVPVAEWPDDAWSIGIEADLSVKPSDPGQRGVGHVVGIAAGRWLIDASIDQTHRAGKIPWIPPLVVELPEGFDTADLTPPVPSVGWRDEGLGLRIFYQASGSRLYATSRNWRRDQPDIREAVADAINRIKAPTP
jgi:hypothetical protein